MLLGLMMVNATACATNGHVNDYCLIAQPIYFDEADVLTEHTEIAIIQHNEILEKLCW